MRVRASAAFGAASLLCICNVVQAQTTPYERSMQQQQLYDLQQQNARQQMQMDQMQRDQQWQQSVQQQQSRAAADQAQAQQVLRSWQQRPPLDPGKNPLLGRWQSLGNGGPIRDPAKGDIMGMARALMGGITAGLCDDMLGQGAVEFRPDGVVAIGPDGRGRLKYHADYRGGGTRVVVLPREPMSFTHMIVDFSGSDQATVSAVGCKLARAGGVPAQAANAMQPVKWDLVMSGSGSNAMDAYVDRASIHRTGRFAQMVSLWDFKSGYVYEGKTSKSVRSEVEYDCANTRSRMLSVRGFADHMGRGPVTDSSDAPLRWQTINAGTPFHAQWKTACAGS
jgi:hypothetical protein